MTRKRSEESVDAQMKITVVTKPGRKFEIEDRRYAPARSNHMRIQLIRRKVNGTRNAGAAQGSIPLLLITSFR